MGKKCSKIGCDNGYVRKNKNIPMSTVTDSDSEEKIRFYTFPPDLEQRRKWIRMIPNKIDPEQAAKGNMSS